MKGYKDEYEDYLQMKESEIKELQDDIIKMVLKVENSYDLLFLIGLLKKLTQ